MSNKSQHSNKEAKKAPSMSLKERRQLKHARKQRRDNPVIVPTTQH